MSRPGRILVAVLMAMVLSGFWILSPGQAQQQGNGFLTVAVVNLPQIFKQAKEIDDLKAQFQAKQDSLEKEAAIRRDRIKALKDARDQFKVDHPNWKKKNQELMVENIELRVWMEEAQNNLLTQHNLQTEQFYDKTMSAIETIARAEGVHIVLYKESYDVKAPRLDELLEKIRQRKVLYNSAQSELTDKVLIRLNGDYKPQP